MTTRTYQSHSAQDRQTVDYLQSEVDERRQNNHKVKHVPSVAEKVQSADAQLEDALGRKNSRKHLNISAPPPPNELNNQS